MTAIIKRHPRAWTAIGLLAIVGVSYLLRSQALSAKFWIDEGLSVGIANHPLTDIPGVLRQDGAPPLYYLLLHVWINLIGGDGEARTHALSLLCALLAIPASWYWARRVFDARSAWITALLMATLPFVTYYAQETRMYTLVVLIGTCAGGAFAAAFVRGDRRALPWFIVFGALAPYSHNWGAFFVAGCGLTWLVLVRGAGDDGRRVLVRDGVLAFGMIALLYLPWLPTVLDQARHTGAPWAESPSLSDLLSVLELATGGIAIALVGGAGLARLRDDEPRWARAAFALVAAAVATVLFAWTLSQFSPAWSGRYAAIVVGPLLLAVGAGLAAAGRLGIVVLVIGLILSWSTQETRLKGKSNVFKVTRTLTDRGLVRDGDTVVSVHPEQGAVTRYYLGPRVHYADALGPVRDPQVFDWRDALDRLQRTGPRTALAEITPGVRPGQRLIVLFPLIRSGRWGAPWTALVRKRSSQWQETLDHDPDYRRLAALPQFGYRRLPRGVRAVVYERR